MRFLVLAPLALLPFLFGACSEAGASSKESAANDTATKIASVLEGITSKETAESSAAELKKLVADLAAAMPKLPSGEEMSKGVGNAAKELAGAASNAAKNLTGELASTLAKVSTEVQRIAKDPALMEPVKGAIEKLQALVKG